MTDLTRIAPTTPKFDYSVSGEQLKSKDRSGVSGFAGRVWNAITRSPDQKEANRAAVKEYIAQIGAKYGLDTAREVAQTLSGHLEKGNPLSSKRIAIINSTLVEKESTPAQRLAGAIARSFNGNPTTDLAQILSSPCKGAARQDLKAALREIGESIAFLPPGKQEKALEKLKNDVISHMQSNGLDVDTTKFKGEILDPILKSANIKAGTKDDLSVGEVQVKDPHLMRGAPLDGPKVTSHARDLTTPQSQGALKTAFGCSSAMVIAEATKTDSVFESLLAKGDTGLGGRVTGFFEGINSYVDTCNDPKVLNHLFGLMTKGFAPGSGGIGRFPDSTGPQEGRWNSEWTKSKFDEKKDPATQSTEIRDMKANLKAMTAFFARNSEAYIGRASPQEKDLRANQFTASIGQVIVDNLMKPEFDQVARTDLHKVLKDHGAMGEIPESFCKTVRNSPLLMELDNSKVSKGMKDIFTKHMDGLLPPGLTGTEKTRLLELLGENLSQEGDRNSGTRGRYGGLSTPIMKEFGKRDQPLSNPMDLPDGNLDKQGLDSVKHLVSGDSQKQVQGLVDTIRGTDLLGHSFRPPTVQRQYAFPTRFREAVLDPQKFLSGMTAREKAPPKGATPEEKIRLKESTVQDKALLAKFSTHLSTLAPEQFKDLGDELGKMKVTSNQPPVTNPPPGRVFTAGELAKEESMVRLIHSFDQRSLCSISGTTTDIMLSLASQMGEDQLKGMLRPLLDFAKGETRTLTDDTKKLLTSISFFMQSGQYHTPAEVLGGLLISTVALVNDKAVFDPDDSGMLRDGYARLLSELSNSPQTMFALSEGDQRTFTSKVGEEYGKLEQTQVQQIQARLGPTGTSFEV